MVSVDKVKRETLKHGQCTSNSHNLQTTDRRNEKHELSRHSGTGQVVEDIGHQVNGQFLNFVLEVGKMGKGQDLFRLCLVWHQFDIVH